MPLPLPSPCRAAASWPARACAVAALGSAGVRPARDSRADGFRVLRAQPDDRRAASAASGAMAPRARTDAAAQARARSLRIRLVNELSEPTSIHWHGVRAAQRHGRRPAPHPAAGRTGRELRLSSSARPMPAPSGITPFGRRPGRSRPPRRADRRGAGMPIEARSAMCCWCSATPHDRGRRGPLLLVNGSAAVRDPGAAPASDCGCG